MSEEQEWVTVRVFKSLVEAEVAYGLLQAHDVPSRLQGKDSVRPELSFATGIFLQVPEDALELAKELLPTD